MLEICKEWIEFNFSMNVGNEIDGNWPALWATACAAMWRWRNKEMHDEHFTRPRAPWWQILRWVGEYNRARQLHDVAMERTRQQIQIVWRPPPLGWIRLNTDDAARGVGGSAGCGGLFRGTDGHWLCGFSRHLGSCTAFVAELWGVLTGLELAWERGFRRVELHVDSTAVVHTLTVSTEGSMMGRILVQRIRRLLQQDWEISIAHSYREANACADCLANLGCDSKEPLIIYESCPVSLGQLLLADQLGVSVPRFISV